MAGKYQAEIDLSNRNNSHTLIVEFVGHHKRVLDVGTATGYLAKSLVERGCKVAGIEIDPEAARQAEEYCEKVIVGDLESIDPQEQLGEETFDVIVFGDVLEHLREPLRILERFKPLLQPEGYMVASIPNIAHGSVRLALMQGRFEYGSLGLLDNTHLRFFTRESVERLFNDAGLALNRLERTKVGIFNSEIVVDREHVPAETLKLLREDPESLTYQFVLTAHPTGGKVETDHYTKKRGEVLRTDLHRDANETTPARRPEHPAPATSEESYDRLTGYGFARQYVGSKSVANIGWEEVGHGSRLLAETAASVVSFTNSAEAVDLASTSHPAPNVDYRRAILPELPSFEDSFDVVVALAVVERTECPEELLKEIKRVLKRSGLLVVSTPDKQVHANERNLRDPDHRREMYPLEFRQLLERHFRHVRTYRQGAVAGGLVIGYSEELSAASVETARPLAASPSLNEQSPTLPFVLAVCSDVEVPEPEEGRPYLLLDRERRIFEEIEVRSEDVELLRQEIQQMQETEVQAFRHALQLRSDEIVHLKAKLKRLEEQTERTDKRTGGSDTNEGQVKRLNVQNEQLRAQVEALKRRLQEIESSHVWRFTGPYRRLRAKLKL